MTQGSEPRATIVQPGAGETLGFLPDQECRDLAADGVNGQHRRDVWRRKLKL
jgi:hypothetical protein